MNNKEMCMFFFVTKCYQIPPDTYTGRNDFLWPHLCIPSVNDFNVEWKLNFSQYWSLIAMWDPQAVSEGCLRRGLLLHGVQQHWVRWTHPGAPSPFMRLCSQDSACKSAGLPHTLHLLLDDNRAECQLVSVILDCRNEKINFKKPQKLKFSMRISFQIRILHRGLSADLRVVQLNFTAFFRSGL